MSNLINLFDYKPKDKPEVEAEGLADIVLKNAANNRRVARDRAKANQKVIRELTRR